MFKFILVILVTLQYSFAGIPSVEALFKNGNNKEIATNGISVSFKIKRFHFDKKVEEENQAEEGVEPLPDEYFVKIYFYQEKENLERFLQLTYKNSNMKEEALAEYIYLPNILKRSLWKSNNNVEKVLFNSVLMSLLLNKSDPLISFLKNNNQKFYKNRDLINFEKKRLLENYKKYLEKVDEDKTVKDSLVSPLKPEDVEEKRES